MPEGNHQTRPIQVWVDADVGIADTVIYLNTIKGIRTLASCQGTIGEGGPNPYRAQVMATWTDEAYEKLKSEFDFTILGDHWGYIHPREVQLVCDDCGKNYADPPSRLCPGCQAYQDHQK